MTQPPPKTHENRPRKPVNWCSELPREVNEAENRAGNTTSERRPRRGRRIMGVLWRAEQGETFSFHYEGERQEFSTNI